MNTVSFHLDAIVANLPKELAAALYEEAQIEATEMKQRCPVAPDGGTLRDSIIVLEPEVKANEVSVSIQAGGPSIDYAVAVHEHPSEHSPPSWRDTDIDWNVPGTGPKFMEGPLMESRPYMGQRLATRINLGRAMGGS